MERTQERRSAVLFYAAGLVFCVAGLSGCGGGGGGGGSGIEIVPPVPANPPPVTVTPSGGGGAILVTLAAPNPSNGVDYRGSDAEFNVNYGLRAINADRAYQRGYFGQGVTIAIVDSGIDATHPDLSPNIVPGSWLDVKNAQTTERDSEGHGSLVALFAAGARGGVPRLILITSTAGAVIPTGNVQGVAPSASIIPVAYGTGFGLQRELRHVISLNAHIVNNSYGYEQELAGTYSGVAGEWKTHDKRSLPYLREFLNHDIATGNRFAGIVNSFVQVERLVRQQDMVMVWAIGNENWNTVNGNIVLCRRRAAGCFGSDRIDVTPRQLANNFNDDTYGRLATLNINLNGADAWNYAPRYAPGLLGKWLAVGATDERNVIASFSNGCGATKYWCIFAPGKNLSLGVRSLVSGNKVLFSGTSFSAPLVSGALAVLKSRHPHMPMEVIRALLLTTATDLGDSGVDDVYGWGLVNLQRAITLQGVTALAGPAVTTLDGVATSRSVRLADAKIALSDSMSHVRRQLAAVPVAVSVVGNAYYNAALGDIAVSEVADAKMQLGAGAEQLLRPSMDNVGAEFLYAGYNRQARQFTFAGAAVPVRGLGIWRLRYELCAECAPSVWEEWQAADDSIHFAARPFFGARAGSFMMQLADGDGIRPFFGAGGKADGADATEYWQFGLRWKKSWDKLRLVAEGSQIDEDGTFIGSDFGALGRLSGRTYQGRLAAAGDLSKNWRGFARYEYAQSKASGGGDFIGEVADVQAQGWSAGVEGESLLRSGDKLRLSLRRETALRSGKITIRHVRAEGSFSEAFYRSVPGYDGPKAGTVQRLQTVETAVDLRDSPPLVLAAAYAFKFFDEWRAALSVEHRRTGQRRETAVAVWLEKEF